MVSVLYQPEAIRLWFLYRGIHNCFGVEDHLSLLVEAIRLMLFFTESTHLSD
jgi:hypothetical protein